MDGVLAMARVNVNGRGNYSKLADWDDDDPSALQETSSRWDKVVILKHMFTLEELEVHFPPPKLAAPYRSFKPLTRSLP